MNGQVYEISLAQFRDMAKPTLEQDEAAALSMHILVGIYNNKPLCYIGFIPLSVMSDTAYIWAMVNEDTTRHKLIFGRHAKAVVARAMEAYTKIIGHCFNETSAKWLSSLGAVFTSNTTFEIRRA